MKWRKLLILLPLLSLTAFASRPSTKIIESFSEALLESDPLIEAVDQDQSDVLDTWMAEGHSPDQKIKNKIGETLFDRAASHASVKVCTVFLDYYLKVKTKNILRDSRGTPILVGLATLAIPESPRSERYEKIIEKILAVFPEAIQSKDRAYVGDGRTALHQAAANGNLPLMKILISHGAMTDAKNAAGETPLHFAARFGHEEVAKYLILSGAKMNTQTTHTRSTPLMLSAEMGQESVMRALLELGANPNLKDAFGKTAKDRFKEHLSHLMAANVEERSKKR